MKFLIMLLVSVSVFAKMDFEKRKSMQVENLNKRIKNITELRDCVSKATKKEDMKTCHEKMKTFRVKMKADSAKIKEMRQKAREERKKKQE